MTLFHHSMRFLFMRSPMQRKYAAKAAHGARGGSGEEGFGCY